MKKKEWKTIKRLLGCFAILICTFAMYLPAQATIIPRLENGKYIKTYLLSTWKNAYVYTRSDLSTRGVSGPVERGYNASIYPSDEIYVYKMTSRYCYVSYPTSRGRNYGYIRSTDIISGFPDDKPQNSRGSMTTYKRAGSGRYGSISNGDRVYKRGESGSYTQVIYPIGGNRFKMGWVATSDYNRYVKKEELTEVNLSSSMYNFESALKGGMVMDVAGGGTGNGTNIMLWQSHGDNNQKFWATRLNSGWYRIKDVNSCKVLDVAGGQRGSGVNVQLYQWNGSDAQLWKFYKDGNNYYYIKNKLGYYLDVSGGVSDNGTNIQVYELNKSGAQKWYLKKTSRYTPVAPVYNLVSQSEIDSAASRYGISSGSNAYKALNLINSKYYSQLKNNENGTNVFLFEGVGASSNASSRMNAMCVVVKNKKIVYINKYSSTIPDNPFTPRLNGGTAVPTMLPGVYNFTTTNHQASKSVTRRYIPYAALHISSGGTNVLRHNSVNSWYYSNSGAINVHGRSGARTNNSANSAGCILVGDIFSNYPSEYSNFIKAVDIVSSGTYVSKATRYSYYRTGKIVIDRSYARDYLRNVGYSSGAVDILAR